MTKTLTLPCLVDGQVCMSDDDIARLIAFLEDDDAVIAAINEEAADDRPYVDGWCIEGYDYFTSETERICSHTPVKVSANARAWRHGGSHPLSIEGAAYTWCTRCYEILSLDNEIAMRAMEQEAANR